MERGGSCDKRSKSTSAFEGLSQIPKLKTGIRLSSHSRSYINASIRDEKSVEIGQSPVGRATDRSWEHLRVGRIYKESEPKRIPKETEPKRRSLSGIARLMHREGPSLWHAYRQKRRLLENYRLNNTSINVEPNRQLYGGQSNGRSPKKQQELKAVYEDLETSSYVSGRYSSRWSACSMLTKSDMALIQKNLDSKRLTHDETASKKLHESDGLYETSGSTDSRDISVQSGRKQKPLLPNLVYDLQGSSSSSLGCLRTLLNPPSSAKYSNPKSRTSNGDKVGKLKTTYHMNSNDGLPLGSHNCHRALTVHRISDIQLKERNKENILPAHIVVLRPNQGDMQNGHGSSPCHSQSYSLNLRKVKGHHSVGCLKEPSWRRKESYYDAEFLKPGYEEARKLANKITRHLKDACDGNKCTICSSFRGSVVVGDLYDTGKGDFNCELEMFNWSSISSFSDDNKRGCHPSSGSVNEEAEKRLTERWKITHRFQDMELAGKGSTLGEIHSTPGEKRSRKTARGHIDRSSSQVGTDNESSIRHGFEGTISSTDSKNMAKRTSRSRSGPPIGGIAHARSACRDILINEKHHSEPIIHSTCKVTKQYPSHKDHFSFQRSRFKGKKRLLCPRIYIEEVDSSLEARFEIQMEANVKDLPYRKLSFQMEEKNGHIGSDAYETVDAEHGITTLPSKTCLLNPNNSSANESLSSTAHDQKDFHPQEMYRGASEECASSLIYLGDKLISMESSSAGYVSPFSVLEIPSVEDASWGSQSLEKLDAVLNDLRMQLQLLRMEDSACDVKSTPILIEKDLVHSSLRAEGWEASYVLDVLISAGLHDFGFDLFRIMWHSPDFPLDPRLFDNLEEKYCNEMAGTRPERLLLFDRINSALSVIFQKHVDLLPWAMAKLGGSLHLIWQKRRARDTIEKLILQESASVLQVAKRMLDSDTHWSDCTDEIALTGNDIEKLLLDDMLNDLLFFLNNGDSLVQN